MSANTLEQRITDYLSGGGLFNPELANHDAVRDLLIECRAALASRDDEAVAQIVSSGPANMPLLQWLSADHSFRAPIGSRLYAAPLSQPKSLEELPPLPLAGEFIPGANKRSILLFTADQMRAYARAALAAATAAAPAVPLTMDQAYDAVKEAGLDWHTGWPVDPLEVNRYLKLVRITERAHGIPSPATADGSKA